MVTVCLRKSAAATSTMLFLLHQAVGENAAVTHKTLLAILLAAVHASLAFLICHHLTCSVVNRLSIKSRSVAAVIAHRT